MIRSSRIPLILDKICTDGISMSLLISKDGELLGSSTTRGSIQQQQQLQQSMEESTLNSKINVPTSKNNELPNPSDVAALIAEVIQDYKRLGCELALLDPSFMPSVSSSNNNVSPGSNVDNTAASTSAVAVGSSGNSSTATVSSSIERDGADKKQTGSDEGNLVGKTDSSKIIKENKNEGHRDKGRLNCLIMEMDMGIIGITSATSSTYVVALAESTTQHGLLKDKLSVLANLFQESLETVYSAY